MSDDSGIDEDITIPPGTQPREQFNLTEQLAVLEAIEDDSETWDGPVSVLCPSCSGVVQQYLGGLPIRVAKFAEECEDCDTDLRRWCVVATNTACELEPTAAQLREVTIKFWDRRLWDGILTGENNPRTDEYSKAFEQKATEFGWNWQVSCPLCRTAVSELNVSRLDYHHWRHDPDQGICLCRQCHEALSGGLCDEELDWKAQEIGLKNKYDLQIARLALREQAVVDYDSERQLVETLTERYNLIHSVQEVAAIVGQIATEGEFRDQLTDKFLLRGIREVH